MPTTRQDKPGGKPRQRSRKTDQRNQKGEPKLEAKLDSDPISAPISDPIVTPIEETPIEAAPVMFTEATTEAALSGEVLPPEVRASAPQMAALEAIALAHSDYTRKSLHAGRFLVERLIAVRSFEGAVEIQGEFAKQAYANFFAHSQKICMLYGEWAQQWFRPFDKFAPEWSRIGR